MRLPLAALALGVLFLALPPAQAAQPCEARLCAEAGYPGPGLRVVVHQHEDCAVHGVLWEGAWMSVADASRWAWTGAPTSEAGALDDRAGASAAMLSDKAVFVAVDAATHAPNFAADPVLVAFWAADTLGNEDGCVLGVVEVTSGMGWI